MKVLDSVVQSLKKHSPEILVGAGVVGVVVGTVMACKETKKIDPILEEHKDTLNDIHMASDTGILVDKETSQGLPYTEKDRRRDLAMCYGKTALELGKLYWPSAMVITGSIGCILTSHTILSKRNIGLTAAYAGISQAFEEYRRNIVNKFGEEADAEARYSVKAKKNKKGEVTYEVTDKTVETDHSRFFDAESRFWDKNANLNLYALNSVEQRMNRLLKTRRSHTVALNEIYGELDLRPADDGQVLGYIYRPGIDPVDENGFPQVIKFAMYTFNTAGNRVFKPLREVMDEGCDETVMLLDFPNLVQIV